ncbi:MAG: hypothetical protein ACRDPY_38500, partial [Streptosporangiaceae bacterium]
MRPDPLSEAAARRHELTRARAVQALRELDRAGTQCQRLTCIGWAPQVVPAERLKWLGGGCGACVSVLPAPDRCRV